MLGAEKVCITIDWLASDWLAGWAFGWFVGWLAGLAGLTELPGLAGWLVGCYGKLTSILGMGWPSGKSITTYVRRSMQWLFIGMCLL